MIDSHAAGERLVRNRWIQLLSKTSSTRNLGVLSAVLLASSAADAKVIYVDISNTKSGDGSTWTKSFTYLQDALEAADPGDDLYLAKGTYFPDDGENVFYGDRELSFELNKVNIYGGFAGGETKLSQRNAKKNPTILSGEIWSEAVSEDYARYWSLHVLVVEGNCTLDSVTVEKGRANGDEAPYNRGGGALVASGSTLTLVDCTIADNLAAESGGGIWGDVVAKRCKFINNVADNEHLLSKNKQDHHWLFSPRTSGGAITGNVTATNCIFSGNSVKARSLDLGITSTATGGAIAGNVTAKGCTFDGNTATSASYHLVLTNADATSIGGAVAGALSASDCTFSNNGASAIASASISPNPRRLVPYTAHATAFGGATAGKISITNCSFAGNKISTSSLSGDFGDSDSYGGAIYAENSSSIMNCTFTENSTRVQPASIDFGDARGGSIHAATESTLPVMNSTFMNNRTSGVAAAVSCAGSVNILSNVFWYDNPTFTTTDEPDDLSQESLIYVSGKSRISNRLYPTPSTETMNVVKGDYTIAVGSGLGANLDFGTTSRTFVTGDPLFVDATSLAGPDGTWRTADDGLRLLAGSSAIGIGHILFVPKDTFDLDNDGDVDERVPVDAADFTRIQNKTLDVGAYEFGQKRHLPDISIEQPSKTVLVDGTSTVNFGTLPGVPVTKTFVIRNTGAALLKGLVVTGTGANIKDFDISQPLETEINTGESTTFTVTLTPNVAGTRTASIHIASNDPDENTFDINLIGTSQVADIVVERPSGSSLTDGESIVEYPKTGILSSTSKTFTIRNNGKSELEIESIKLEGANDGDFKASKPANSLIAPGKSTTFDITFIPTDASDRIARVLIASNDPDKESIFSFKVTGKGLASPEISVNQPLGTELTDGESKSFGAVKKGLAYTKRFTIKNVGSNNLKDIAVAITGSSSFTATKPTVTTLKPGTEVTFTVSFKPASIGKKEAMLKIRSNDSDESPFNVVLTGTGFVDSASPAFGFLAAASDSNTTLALAGTTSGGTVSVSTVDGLKYLVLTVEKSGLAQPTIEVSPNLVDWFSGSSHTTTLQDSATVIKVRDNTPIKDGEKRYIRVK